MSIFTLFLISLSLSGDAFAVSVANSMYRDNINFQKVLISSGLFGIMQAVMPCIGFYFGGLFSEFLIYAQKWIVLFILSALGINMILTYIREKVKNEKKEKCRLNLKNMLLQSISTSIDAFSMGIGFAAMGINMPFTAFVIGTVTFFCCLVGYSAGDKIKKLIGDKAELAGGIILILIGIKIFVSGNQKTNL